MDHEDVKTTWDLMVYIAEHRAAIPVRHERRSVYLAEIPDALAAEFVGGFIAKWAATGFIPHRVVRDPDDAPVFTTTGPVHRLHHGVPACGLPGLPKDWPAGHVWSAHWKDVTCLACRMHIPADEDRLMSPPVDDE